MTEGRPVERFFTDRLLSAGWLVERSSGIEVHHGLNPRDRDSP